jgi:crossover junction endodeoxyribonuclease RusA
VGIVLPYPHKSLWPNGRSHWAEKAREVKKHRKWAYLAAREAKISIGNGPVPVHIVVQPKARGPAPDRDNAVSACKAYIDGIAEALGVNDRHFAAPTVTISEKRLGRFEISIGE